MLHKYSKQIIVLAEAIIIALAILSLVWIRGCGIPPKNNSKGGECASEGQTRSSEDPNPAISCPAGESGRVFQVCKQKRWVETFNDCKSACSITAFQTSVSPLIKDRCLSCHSTFADYNTAKAKIGDFIQRTSLGAGDPNRMPKAPSTPLSNDEKAIFQNWQKDGLKDACPDQVNQTNPHLDLNYVEDAILQDLNGLSSAEQRDARYFLTTNKSDEGANTATLAEFERGIYKTANSLSFSRDIILGKPIDKYRTIFRYFLRDLKLDEKDWAIVEAADQVNIESFTTTGTLIKQLVNTRKPWMYADSIAFQAMSAKNYYQLRKLPLTKDELFKQIGANIDKEQDDFTALFIGFADSPIAENKPRLLVKIDTNDGELFQTFDSDANKFDDTRNVFKRPLLKSTDGKTNLASDASEFIFSSANSLHIYYLANAQGARQDVAPITVVRDTQSPFSAEIQSAISCTRCHNGGMIEQEDEVRAHVNANADQFSLDDVDRVNALYRDPKPEFDEANNKYREALSKMGISPNDPDPINLISDNIRKNFDAQAVAAILLLTKDEFLTGLQKSPQGRQELGSLLTGGSVTAAQLFEVLPDVIRDLRIASAPFP